MRHRASGGFWSRYEKLPASVRKVADQKFALLKSDLNHPSLRFKKVGKVWSVRVSQDYRALAHFDGEDYIWIWIGTHSEYDKIT